MAQGISLCRPFVTYIISFRNELDNLLQIIQQTFKVPRLFNFFPWVFESFFKYESHVPSQNIDIPQGMPQVYQSHFSI